jgi:hypothetical protein
MNQPRGFSVVADAGEDQLSRLAGLQAQLAASNPPNPAAVGAQLRTPAAAPTTRAFQEAVANRMLMMGLGALARRSLIAFSNLFTFLTVVSAFALWWYHPDPSPTQLISLGMYAMFVLLVNFFYRSKDRDNAHYAPAS